MKVLNELGFSDINFSIEDIINEDQLIMFGEPPMRIDILTSISGIKFNEAFDNKFVNDFGPIKDVNFISLKDLLKNKMSSNRKKDQEDLRWIKTYGKDN